MITSIPTAKALRLFDNARDEWRRHVANGPSGGNATLNVLKSVKDDKLSNVIKLHTAYINSGELHSYINSLTMSDLKVLSLYGNLINGGSRAWAWITDENMQILPEHRNKRIFDKPEVWDYRKGRWMTERRPPGPP